MTSIRCPGCGESWPPNLRFCGFCGTPLQTLKREEERKIVSVLFVDLVGFTRMSERMDVEEVEALLDRYFAAVNRIVTRYGGHVDKLIGDAALVVFGAPRALEDHALRAVQAALDLRDWAQQAGLQLHIGVHSGEVLITLMGAGQAQDYTVLGDTVNVAQRIQSLTGPNEILISGVTHALVEPDIDAEPAGEVQVKNRARPVILWRVLARREASHRPPPLLPFVGRTAEVQRIQEALSHRGDQLLIVTGEMGVGKTRLLDEALPPHPTLTLRGTPGSAPLALLRGDRGATFVRTWITQHPEGILRVEDFQWADLPSLDTLRGLIMSLSHPLRMVVTTRPEGEPELSPFVELFTLRGGNVLTLRLSPLSPPEVEELLDTLDLTPSLRETLTARVQGNPLFIEEFYRLYRAGDLREIPTRVESLFAAQIDALPPEEKDTLKRLSVLGTAFARPLLPSVGVPPDHPALLSLIRRGMITEEGETLRFRHPLLRDTAWQRLLVKTRRALHLQVLNVLERRSTPPHILARHAYEAGAWDKAEAYGLEGIQTLLDAGDPREALQLVPLVSRAIQHTGSSAALHRLQLLQARALFMTGDRGKALDVLRALQHVPLPGDLEQEHRLLMASILSVSGGAQEGLRLLTPLLNTPSPRVQLTHIRLLVETGNIEEARKLAESLEASLQGTPDSPLLEEVQIERMRLFVFLMDLSGFQTWVRRVFQRERSPRLEAYLAHWMAVARRMAHRMEEAYALHQRAIEIAQEQGLRESWPLFLLEYARTLRAMKRHQEARHTLDRIRVLAPRYQDPVILLKARMEKGFLLVEEGAVREGVRELEGALQEAEREDPFTASGILHNLGAIVFLDLGDIPRARFWLHQCLQRPQAREDPAVYHFSHLLLHVIGAVEGPPHPLPPESLRWVRQVPSVMAQTLLAWARGEAAPELPHALPFPSLPSSTSWEAFLHRLIDEKRERLLRFALWKALGTSPLSPATLREVYLRVLEARGVPAIYRSAIPFKTTRSPEAR